METGTCIVAAVSPGIAVPDALTGGSILVGYGANATPVCRLAAIRSGTSPTLLQQSVCRLASEVSRAAFLVGVVPGSATRTRNDVARGWPHRDGGPRAGAQRPHSPSSSRNGVRAKRRTTYPGSMPRRTSSGGTIEKTAPVLPRATEMARVRRWSSHTACSDRRGMDPGYVVRRFAQRRIPG